MILTLPSKTMPLDEKRSIGSSKFDKVQVLEDLFKKYRHHLLAICYSYLKNRQDSEDAVMDIFQKAMRKLRPKHLPYVKNWLLCVTRNQCISHLRRAAHRNVTFMDPIILDLKSVENQSDKRYYNEDRIDTKTLEAALQKLKDGQRRCLLLFYEEEKTYQEIAQITGFEVKQVKSLLQNGKRNLKNMLI